MRINKKYDMFYDPTSTFGAKAKKKTVNILIYILLITLSLIFSKKVLAIIAISYMLLSLLFTLIKRINKDRFNNKVLIFIIVLSIIGFIIFLSIDLYKIWKHDKKRYN